MPRKLGFLAFLAALTAVITFAASWVTPASADVGPLTATSNAPALNTPVTISGTVTTAGPIALTIQATSGSFGSGGLNTGEQGTGTGTNQMTIQVGSQGPHNLSLNYTCTTAGAATITVQHQGANPQTIVINCGGAGSVPVDPNANSGGLVVNPPSGTSATVTGTCAQGAQLTIAGSAYFTGATLNGTAITGATGSSSATCATAGSISASVICTTQGTATFQLGSSRGTLTCTSAGPSNCGAQALPSVNGQLVPGVNNQAACPQTSTSLSTTASGITIAAAPSTVGCTGTSSVTTLTITVNGPNGAPVADKTPVQVTADAGVVSAPSLQTLNGKASTPYTAPSSPPAGGSVTVRATAAGATGQTQVALSCSGSASTAGTTAPPPVNTGATSPSLPPPPPAATGNSANSVFRPPNTGDAGLKARSQD